MCYQMRLTSKTFNLQETRSSKRFYSSQKTDKAITRCTYLNKELNLICKQNQRKIDFLDIPHIYI